MLGVLFAGLVPPAQAASGHAPLAVFAGDATVESVSAAFVAWSSGETLADFYKVYGIRSSTKALLAVATNFTAPVPAGYTAYGVSGVKNGIESELVLAIIVPCTYLDPTPPPPNYYIGECQSGTVVQD